MATYSVTGVIKSPSQMVIELIINEPPPPLILLINPQSLDFKYTPKITTFRTRWTDQNYTPYILHTHHDELDTLSIAGTSAMFYSDKGITVSERTSSIAWENIQQLIAVYRNNGMNFDKKPGKRGAIESVGRVSIYFENIFYYGSFDNFTLNEVDEKPFNMTFNFDFKVTKVFGSNGTGDSVSQF